MAKDWRNFEEQAQLLKQRGIQADSTAEIARFLRKVNYYRFSGYFRYWQQDPANGENRFFRGTAFDDLKRLYDAEHVFTQACAGMLHAIEVLLRNQFAFAYSKHFGTTGAFTLGEGFTQSPNPKELRVEQYVLRDLDRSKEKFVTHYRPKATARNSKGACTYEHMPIWAAVEAFTFGTLSRLIEASGDSGVLDTMAEEMKISRRYLPGQVRSFVYLRNRIAHCSRVWNHLVLEKPGMNRNVQRRAQKSYRNFADNSVYKICVALSDVASKTDIADNWLGNTIEPILQSNKLLAAGITHPAKYGDLNSEFYTVLQQHLAQHLAK